MNSSVRRNSGFARTALLCLIAAVGGAGAALVFTQKQKAELRAEIGALREQARQMEAKSTDPKEVEKLRAQVREAAEFKKEAEEVHRLRGEVTVLRKDKAEFDQTKAEVAQLRIAAQQFNRAQTENKALRELYERDVLTLQRAQQPVAPGVIDPDQARRNSCIANLKQIDGAIQQWALENRKAAKDLVDWKGIQAYLKGGVLPACAAGGIYQPGVNVTAAPTCTVPGHKL
ncbi:MAG: hypothetical protein ABMA26_21540 [Limisphaerales bacterium]